MSDYQWGNKMIPTPRPWHYDERGGIWGLAPFGPHNHFQQKLCDVRYSQQNGRFEGQHANAKLIIKSVNSIDTIINLLQESIHMIEIIPPQSIISNGEIKTSHEIVLRIKEDFNNIYIDEK